MYSIVPVFNVTGQDGNKVTDEAILDYIRKVGVSFFVLYLLGLYITTTEHVFGCICVCSLLVPNLVLLLPLDLLGLSKQWTTQQLSLWEVIGQDCFQKSVLF